MHHKFDIRVINLKRAKKRKKEFITNNSCIDFTFFDAIDGNKLSNNDLVNTRYFIQPLPFHTMGAYGCALSHIKLWEECVIMGTPLTIVEDDAIFRHDFYKQASEVITQAKDFDIILWGFNLDSVLSLDIMPNVSPAFLKFSQSNFRKYTKTFQGDTTAVYPNKLYWSLGIPAYTISPKGAKYFLENVVPIKDFNFDMTILNIDYFDKEVFKLCSEINIGIDVSMARFYKSCSAFVSLPPLAISCNEISESYIHPFNKKNKTSKDIKL